MVQNYGFWGAKDGYSVQRSQKKTPTFWGAGVQINLDLPLRQRDQADLDVGQKKTNKQLN
jgi:hypothetical protein